MKLGRFSKTPAERKRYAVDYSQWLETGETVTQRQFVVTPATTPPMEVDASSITNGGLNVVFFVSNGKDAQQYKVELVSTTSLGQVKEDVIYFNVKDI